MKRTHKWAWTILAVASVGMLAASLLKLIPSSVTEALGFVSGAVCVLFVVEENIWNFPIGIANNIFFIILFLTARLYGDMTLQFVYIALGIMGWYQWLHGGANRSALKVNHTNWREVTSLALIGAFATAGLREYFIRINDAAPLLDAVTTVLSLIAQYLLNYKRIENWYVWITADILYVWLYIQKDLHLTAALYAIFIGMCVTGLVTWSRTLREEKRAGVAP